MNTRFYNAKILVLDAENHFSIAEDELHVTGDTITYIGPGRKADPDAAETTVFDREIDARGNLLIPGFKNAHTHTPMTFLRSYADDLPLHEWLERQVFPNEAKLAGDDVYWLNILGIMEYLTSGITSNFDMYIQQKNSIAATVDTGFRTVLTSGLNNFVDSPEILEEMYNYVNELSDRTSYLLGFHAEYTTGGPLLEAVAKLAEKYHSPVWTHNAETKSEVEGCKERWGLTPTQLMERLGMFQYGGGAHAMQLTDCDRLAAGKKADLVMIDLHQPNMQPENNLIKNLVYSGSKQNVKLTMVNGQILYENGEFHIGFDPEEIYARSNAIIRRISGSHADN